MSPRTRRRCRGDGRPRELLEALQQAARGAEGRHQGGKKWIGTGGTSPFGTPDNPEGIRIGGQGQHRRAVKVSDQREYKDLETRSSSARATSRSRCAACASSRAPARPTSSISTTPSRARRTRAISTSTCGPSGTTPSRCWRCSTWAARSTGTSSWWRNCFQRRARSSSTLRISTSTIACTRKCGRRTAAASRRRRRPGTCCTSTRTTTRW